MNILRLAATATISLLVTTAVSFAQDAKLEKPSLTLAVGGKTLVAYLPLTIADRLGFFKHEGLQVEIDDFAGGAKALQSLVGGSADVVCGAYEHTIFMAAKDVKITAIALQNDSFGLVVGLSKEKAKSYKGPADLKGLKIGVTSPGSASTVGLSLLLAKANLTLNDVSVIGVGGGARAVTAMQSGQIDGMANFDPVMSMLERGDNFVSIVDTRKQKDLDELYSGPFAASAFYMQSSFTKNNPRTTQAFVNAIYASLQWIANATTDQIVDAVSADYYGGDKELYRAVVEKNRGRFSKTGQISMATAQNVLRIIASQDEKVKASTIDLAETFDNSFLEKAQKKTN